MMIDTQKVTPCEVTFLYIIGNGLSYLAAVADWGCDCGHH